MAPENRKREPADGVLTQVCVNCGQEYFFESAPPPRNLQCERCGSLVFRSFFDVSGPDDVEQDFQDVTSRDTATDDPGTDITTGDLYDLNNP